MCSQTRPCHVEKQPSRILDKELLPPRHIKFVKGLQKSAEGFFFWRSLNGVKFQQRGFVGPFITKLIFDENFEAS
jgi:hypothetical protein